jgi:hypothetical protein
MIRVRLLRVKKPDELTRRLLGSSGSDGDQAIGNLHGAVLVPRLQCHVSLRQRFLGAIGLNALVFPLALWLGPGPHPGRADGHNDPRVTGLVAVAQV